MSRRKGLDVLSRIEVRVRWGMAAAAAFACIVVFAMPMLAEAQYFGRNKVLWEQFDFEVLQTEHFDIYYYPPDADSADYVARIAERWYERLSTFFDHEFEERKPLIVYQDHADFQQTVVSPGIIGEGTGGFTEPRQDRVVLPLTGINADNDHVIGHELVHEFQFDIAQQAQREGREVNVQRLPLWAVEGLAEYLSQGRDDPATAMQMRDAVLHQRLPDPTAFLQRQLSPYQYGQALWAYVAGRWDDDTVRRLFLALAAATSGSSDAFESVLDLSEEDFKLEFHDALRSAYAVVLEERQPVDSVANVLLSRETTGAALNLAPSVSPDGRWIAFLSTRELAIELFLADAKTGEIVRKLVSAETDPHFDNLSFLDSSAAWSPDSRRLAFSVFAEGERRLAIYDLDSNEVEKTLDLAGIHNMRHAAWSPDGRSLVFSAGVGGASDLYLVDVETGNLLRLTDDAYTAIQPAFSPDGRQIVFVTDRGAQTHLDLLDFGPMQLALLDLDSGEIETLSIFDRGNHVDPHFAPDGRSIYFIAEPDGIPDIFRYDLLGGTTSRVTRLKTGVTGITATSPALSIAPDSGALVFSVLEDGNFSVFTTRASQGSAEIEPSAYTAGMLPPMDAEPEVVAGYLEDPELGLDRDERAYQTHEYDSHMRFTDFAPATIGVGTSTTGGAGFGGAFAALFNDPLNRHQLSASLLGGVTQGDVIDFEDSLGIGVTYLNQAHRFQWGVRGSRVPYISTATFVSRGPFEIDGTVVPADVVERLFDIVTVSEGAFFGRYPFSLNNRVEVSAGLSRIDFEREVEQLVYPLQDFSPFRREFGVSSPEALNLETGSFAFVRDTSRFGFTSPVSGTRIRAEMEYTRGDLSFRTTTLDYRRYFFRRPLTFAFRALHVGRRGQDADDFRLPPLDVGNSRLVHGYDLGSFDLSECTIAPDAESRSCPEFQRLVGSRIGVLNFELRLPLLGNEDFGLFNAPAMPTELAFFVDVGAAWSSGQSVDLSFERETTRRVPVVSSGIALRTVVLGSLPLEFYYAHPYQRPKESSVFGVNINVGW